MDGGRGRNGWGNRWANIEFIIMTEEEEETQWNDRGLVME